MALSCKAGIKIILEDIVEETNRIREESVGRHQGFEYVANEYEKLLEKTEARLRALQRGSGF